MHLDMFGKFQRLESTLLALNQVHIIHGRQIKHVLKPTPTLQGAGERFCLLTLDVKLIGKSPQAQTWLSLKMLILSWV